MDKIECEKNCKICEYPCINAGYEDLKPITEDELKRMGYIICNDFAEDFSKYDVYLQSLKNLNL